MPNATEIIDETILHEENLGPADAYNVTRRALHLIYLKWSVARIQLEREWPWRQTSSTVTVTTPNGYGSLPTDFSSVGKYGGVYHPTTFDPLFYVSPQQLREDRRLQRGATTDAHKIYSWFDQDTSDPFAARLQLLVNSTTVSVPIDYLKRPLTVDEAANVEATKQIPEQFHRTVLIPHMIYLIRDARGQSDAATWYAQYENGLKQMQREVLPPGGSQAYQLPQFFGDELLV